MLFLFFFPNFCLCVHRNLSKLFQFPNRRQRPLAGERRAAPGAAAWEQGVPQGCSMAFWVPVPRGHGWGRRRAGCCTDTEHFLKLPATPRGWTHGLNGFEINRRGLGSLGSGRQEKGAGAWSWPGPV